MAEASSTPGWSHFCAPLGRRQGGREAGRTGRLQPLQPLRKPGLVALGRDEQEPVPFRPGRAGPDRGRREALPSHAPQSGTSPPAAGLG